jgi:hypothetical protein
MPMVPVPEASHSTGRRRQQHHTWAIPLAQNANEALSAINCLWGASGPERRVGAANRMQQEAAKRVEGLICDQEPSLTPLRPEAALSELLRGRTTYNMGAGQITLAAYQPELLSIPDSLTGCPLITEVVREDARLFLECPAECMILSETEFLEASGKLPDIKPYFDPKLKYNQKEYRRFIRRLRDIGFLHHELHPRERVGVFFVHESHGRIRMIIDARRANRRFKPPPGVQLCAGEGLSSIEVELPAYVGPWCESAQHLIRQTVVRVGLADVKDCFHRLRSPKRLSEYFAVPEMSAATVGLQGMVLDGVTLGPQDPVWPCPGSLCVGFAWSFYFAQRVNESLSRVPASLAGPLITHRGPPLVVRAGSASVPRHYVYVDNLGALGASCDKVAHVLSEWHEVFTRRGLLLCGEEIQTSERAALGVRLDGQAMKTLISNKRFWKIRQGIVALLNRGRCARRVSEVVIGHCAFAAVCHFIQSCFWNPAPRVRAELVTFLGVMWFLQSDWTLPWSPYVCAADSSTRFWYLTFVLACRHCQVCRKSE